LFDDVRAQAKALGTIRVFSPSRVDFAVPGEYLALCRRDFDALLMQAAIDSGATCVVGDVVEVADNAEIVEVRLRACDQPLRARVVVLAAGAVVHLLRRLGTLTRPTPSALACRTYVRSDLDLDHVVISYDRLLAPGYAWIVPLGGSAVQCRLWCGAQPASPRGWWIEVIA
jgi:flavin-dependent dehydrogenase